MFANCVLNCLKPIQVITYRLFNGCSPYKNVDFVGGTSVEIAGIREQLFSEEAILAIHQGSGGLLRRANILARGSLIAAAAEKCNIVSGEHVRIASTEII